MVTVETTAQATFYCRKSELQLSLLHGEGFTSHAKIRGLAPAIQGCKGVKRPRKFFPEKSVQPIDKSRFGRENPRNSKEIQPPFSGDFTAKEPPTKTIQMTDKAARP
jgi:hypothetical protein